MLQTKLQKLNGDQIMQLTVKQVPITVYSPLTMFFFSQSVPFSVFREEFRLEPQDTRVAQGETALLECGPPKGTPEPVVSWRKNGQKLELENTKR